MKKVARILPIYSLVGLLIPGTFISFSGTVTPAFAQCVPAPPGMVSWWRGENTTTDDWDSNDGPAAQLGLPFPGSYTVTFGTGKVGNAFASSFTVEDSASLRVSNGLTIEAWVYLDATFGTTNRTIVSKYGLPSAVSYLLACTNRTLYLEVSPSGTAADRVAVRAPQPLPLTNWIQVAGTYDGTALRLYTNGALVATLPYSAGIYQGLANVGIGRVPTDPNVTETTTTNGFWTWRGLLDEVSLYNRALTSSELNAIAQADGSGKCLSPPIILVQPASQAIPLGEDVMFTAKVVGAKPITYSWAPAFGTVKPQGPSLLIEKVQASNAGSYSLLASNSLGHINSSNATLTLLPPNHCFQAPPDIVDWWPGDGTGQDVVGGLTAFSSDTTAFVIGKVGEAFSPAGQFIVFPPLESGWQVPNASTLNFGPTNAFSIEAWVKAPVPRNEIRGGLFGTTSDIETILRKVGTNAATAGYALFLDRGRLCCSLHTTSSTTSNLLSSFGPDLRDGMFHHVAVSVLRNSTNGGNLYVDGQSVLTFDTTALSGAISNSAALGFMGSETTIRTLDNTVTALDEVSFYNRALSANEVLGIRNAGAAGKCKGRPLIDVQPVSQNVLLGTDVTFTVVAEGTPPLRYSWRFGNSLIPGAANPSLTISNVTPAKAGAYSVSVINGFGTTISAAAILNLIPVALCSNVVVTAGSNCLADASVDAGSFDPDSTAVSLQQVPAGPYPIGTTPVTLYASDNRGATNSCSASVTVLPPPPQILCPTLAAKANDLHQCGAVVVFPLPQVTDLCSAITNITFDPPSGSFFSVGTTTVNCTAADAAGNSAQCSFSVTVMDLEPPTLSCPPDIVVTNAHDAWTSIVTYQIGASDNCPGVGAVSASPASGSSFALGTHTVSCTATDAVGNLAQCVFNVTVLPGNHPPIPVIEIAPLAQFPGWTNLIVIAPQGISADVSLDGSKSSDPDGDPFTYQWTDGTNVLSTNMVAGVTLAVGTHEITLSLDDGLPLGTNSLTATLEVISPATAVTIVTGLVQDSSLAGKDQKPLIASLNAAGGSFQRGNFIAGQNQLRAFQNKVDAQISPTDSDLAATLISAAQLIINAIR